MKKQIKIKGITLLSKKEYYRYHKNFYPVNSCWWLRSPGCFAHLAEMVDEDGDVNRRGNLVGDSDVGVRPALKIANLKSSDYDIRDKFTFMGYTWTVISRTLCLCDSIIGKHCFRENWLTVTEDDRVETVKDASCYEASDIKKFLEDWWSEKNDQCKNEIKPYLIRRNATTANIVITEGEKRSYEIMDDLSLDLYLRSKGITETRSCSGAFKKNWVKYESDPSLTIWAAPVDDLFSDVKNMFVLVKADIEGITHKEFRSLEDAKKAMKDNYDSYDPPVSEEWENLSWCGESSAVLYDNGEDVIHWEIFEVNPSMPENGKADREYLNHIYRILESFLGDEEPKEKELGYDNNAITLYHNLHCLKNNLEKMGYYG